MTDIQDDHEAGRAPETDNELSACQQRVRDLTAELTQTLWQMGYFIAMTCALGHLGSAECDCDERIGRINERLAELKSN